MRLALVIGSVFALTIGVLPAIAQTPSPSGSGNAADTVGRVVRVDVSVGGQLGDRIRGPITLVLENVNILRYDVQLRRNVTVSDASTFTGLPFVPAIPEPESDRLATVGTQTPEAAALEAANALFVPFATDTGGGWAAAAGGPLGGAADSLLLDASQTIERLSREWDTNGRETIAEITRNANDTRRAVMQVIGQSDLLLQMGQRSQLTDRTRRTLEQIDRVLEFTWPDSTINRVMTRLETTKASLLPLQAMQLLNQSWIGNDNQDLLRQLLRRIDELTAEANTASGNGETADSLAALQRRFREVRPVFDLIANLDDSDSDPFSRTIEVDCDRSDGRGRDVQVELVRTERIDTARAASPTVLTTVECWSPFSISAGWGMSRLWHDEALTPLPPVMLVHAEVLRLGRTGWTVNLSSGASVGLPVGEEGGDLEYLLGGSVSVSRDLFISGLLHFTTEESGDDSDEQDGTTRFALAVSYRVK